MSKPVQKHKHSRKRIEPHRHKVSAPARRGGAWSSTAKQLGGKPFVLFIIIAILAAIPFCMGKYFEFNSPDPYDSGCYVYSARHILDGAKIGVDEKPSAQMGTLLINMLGVRVFGFTETGPKLLQMILQAAALVMMFIAMRKLFGILPAAVGVIIASTYLSAPLIAKFGNVKEQHMIAFMVLGISCLVLYQLGGKWWLACLAGAFVAWAPLFKETGFSVIGAVGLFVIAQPLLKHRSWKKTGTDILLMFAGVFISISPICIWLASQKAPMNYFPYSSLWRPIVTSLQGSQDQGEPQTAKAESDVNDIAVRTAPANQGLLMKFLPSYVRDSWQILKPEQIKQAKLRVFRWYRLLILPIALALGSIIIRIFRIISVRLNKTKSVIKTPYDRFVLLFAVWWFLDMAFVWISPRSYEQYYLPLNASGAMLGGYLIAIYHDKVKSSAYKNKWVIAGLVGLLLMIIMSQHIFFGIKKSAHTGAIYRDPATGSPKKDKGYAQKMDEISRHPKYAWMLVGEHIRNNSTPDDKIYVWGWVPGIYIAAQRLSPAPKAFEGTMHTLSPKVLSERVDEILDAFEKEPPKFIVDSRKNHFPWDRPPLELWPRTQQGFLPAAQEIVSQYDAMYAKMLREKIESDEALRYEAMKPFREFVMKNYKIVRTFVNPHVLFQRK
ncbi:MAG TPA: glycosyltransferase family 39 protein [Sedimentisphaerales bacterium]|nr:glycosyltransferase family 39 protein [Sedimentisphaerales bacterium]